MRALGAAAFFAFVGYATPAADVSPPSHEVEMLVMVLKGMNIQMEGMQIQIDQLDRIERMLCALSRTGIDSDTGAEKTTPLNDPAFQHCEQQQ